MLQWLESPAVPYGSTSSGHLKVMGPLESFHKDTNMNPLPNEDFPQCEPLAMLEGAVDTTIFHKCFSNVLKTNGGIVKQQ